VWKKFDPAQKETLGVKLCDWRVRDCPGGEVLAHVWDFAGQTITHSMHQFFLSVRTVYVLVLTGRENSEREDAEYWLRLIAAYGIEECLLVTEKGELIFDENGEGLIVGDPILPPVIVVLNKWDDRGSARARVVPYDEYRRICRACGVADEERQDLLAENLHALGVALNFRRDERLRFASVLKPHWLTEHVYALVRHAEEKAGRLDGRVWPHAEHQQERQPRPLAAVLHHAARRRWREARLRPWRERQDRRLPRRRPRAPG